MSPGGELNLDIEPGKRDNRQGEGVTGKPDTDCPSGYTAYKYVHQENVDFDLTGISYEGETIESLKTFKKVTNVTTYFKNSDLLLIHLKINRKDFYYANKNYYEYTTKTKFDNFVRGSNRTIGKSDLKTILDNIVRNEKLVYDTLPEVLKRDFWRENSVVFDLSKKIDPDKGGSYNSDITGAPVSLIEEDRIKGTYPKIKHSTNSPFYIKGLKNGQNVTVEGGLPSDPLEDFSVYYGKGDGTYGTPLLITLKVDSSSVIPGGIENYYISKNKTTGKWDKLTLSKTEINEEEDIPKIIDNITKSGKLEIEKFKDVTKNLVINLKEKFDKKDGFYTSGGINITYTKTEYSSYTAVRHAYNLQNFTVEKIETSLGEITSADLLPPKSALIKNLSVFYHGNTTTDPWLISILYEGFQRLWLCRHPGDKNWSILRFEIPKDDTDGEKIEALLKKLQIPNVTIDFSKPVSKNGSPYTPEGSPSTFNVTNVPVVGSPGYYGLKHAMQGGDKFLLRKVIYRDTQLDGIRSLDPLENITAFFLKDVTDKMEELLLVELVTSGEKPTYRYYFKETSGTKIWRELIRFGQESTPLDGQLKTTLDKQNCLQNHFHGLNLSKRDGKNEEQYFCTINCRTKFAVNGATTKGGYPRYIHYKLRGNGGFRTKKVEFDGKVLEGIPYNILFHRLTAYFSPKGQNSIPLLIRLETFTNPPKDLYYEKKERDGRWTEYKRDGGEHGKLLTKEPLTKKLDELRRIHFPPAVIIQMEKRDDYPKPPPKAKDSVVVSNGSRNLEGFTEYIHRIRDHGENPFTVNSFHYNDISTNINGGKPIEKVTGVSVYYGSGPNSDGQEDQRDIPLLVKIAIKDNGESFRWFENEGGDEHNRKWKEVLDKLEEGDSLNKRLEAISCKVNKEKAELCKESPPKKPEVPPVTVPEAPKEVVPEKKVPAPPPKKPEVPPVSTGSEGGSPISGVGNGDHAVMENGNDLWKAVGTLVATGVYGSVVAGIFGWCVLEKILCLVFAPSTSGDSGHSPASPGGAGGEGTVHMGGNPNPNGNNSFPWGTVIGSLAGVLGVIIIVFLIYRGRRVFSPSKRL